MYTSRLIKFPRGKFGIKFLMNSLGGEFHDFREFGRKFILKGLLQVLIIDLKVAVSNLLVEKSVIYSTRSLVLAHELLYFKKVENVIFSPLSNRVGFIYRMCLANLFNFDEISDALRAHLEL